MPDATVSLEVYKGSDYPERSLVTVKTDKDGKYLIQKRIQKNRGYKVFCYTADSGTYRSSYLTREQRQFVDIFLE